MAVPPGVSAQVFAQAVREFEAAVGKEWVFTSDEDVALYRDAYSVLWGEPDERLASAARRARIGWSRSSRWSRSPTPTRFRSTRCPLAAIWATAGRRPTIPAASSST